MKGINTIKKGKSLYHTPTHTAHSNLPSADRQYKHTHTHRAYMQSLLDKIKQTTLYSIETLSRKVKCCKKKKKNKNNKKNPKKIAGYY